MAAVPTLWAAWPTYWPVTSAPSAITWGGGELADADFVERERDGPAMVNRLAPVVRDAIRTAE